MADYPPFMNAYGNLTKILNKIKEAKTPERFSQDYLATVLGFSGGSSRPFISVAKRIGMLNPDGSPTALYSQFRNPAQSEAAMAAMIRIGYPDLYKRNEYAHALSEKDLTGLAMEVTGLDASSTTLKAIVNTFLALKSFANFEIENALDEPPRTDASDGHLVAPPNSAIPLGRAQDSIGVRFSHNIFINLPDTDDVEVFNAIFRALKANLLS